MEMTKKEEKKSEWYWEIGDKKTNKPNEVIAWLIVEKAKLEEENKKLIEQLERMKTDTMYDMKDINSLYEENKKLKSDLSECECSMHFENDEVGYRKRECKKLKEEVRFLEECLDRKEKLNKKYRKELKSTYVYDAKQVRDIC